MILPVGTLLQEGKYRIICKLGQGGFGITYLATMSIDVQGPLGKITTNVNVAIKEFFMKDVCLREDSELTVTVPTVGSKEYVEKYRVKFRKEAELLSKFNHPHIVKVLDVFDENETTYSVMEYLDGGSLQSFIKKNKKIDEETSIKFACQIADALGYMHDRHFCHLDVKPNNVMLSSDHSKVSLIDFGLSKRYTEDGQQTSSTPIALSEGYAPMEQYEGGMDEFSPTSDIYSLGATLFCMVTGQKPPKASTILNNGLPNIADTINGNVIDTIVKSMSPKRKDRQQSTKEFIDMLNKKESVVEEEEMTMVQDLFKQSEPSPDNSHNNLPDNSKKEIKSQSDNLVEVRNNKPFNRKLIYGIAALVLLPVIIFFFWPDSQNEEPENRYVVEVGDYYYSDGSLSHTLDPNKKSQLIGRVFTTKMTDYEIKQGWTHGKIVAMSNASPKFCNWGSTDKDLGGNHSNVNLNKDARTDCSGFLYTYQTDTLPSSYGAFHQVFNYGVKLPEETSGWYLPSVGEWVAIMENLAKLNVDDDMKFDGKEAGALLGASINLTTEYYWTSLELNADNAWYIHVGGGEFGATSKIGRCKVRTIASF